jgi:hypothetical protein
LKFSFQALSVLAGAASLLFFGCGTVTPADNNLNRNMNLPKDLKLRAGRTELGATAPKFQLLAAIERSNQQARLEGLPDYLNPEIIDADKAQALLSAIANSPADTSLSLAQHTLYLNYPGLMIGSSAPTRPANFVSPLKIKIDDVQGELVLAQADVPLDCPLARDRAGDARTRFKEADGQLKELEKQIAAAGRSTEKQRQVLAEVSLAQRRRFAIAQVWRQNAAAWASCPDTDKGAKADLDAASRALRTSVVVGGAGMP